jgi:hypothetical protein
MPLSQNRLPAVDGFQRAIEVERLALEAAIAATPGADLDRLMSFVAELYCMLRSPIFPRRAYQVVAGILVHGAIGAPVSVRLNGILASSTARAEIRSILRCADAFRRHGINPRLQLYMVQWENLADLNQRRASLRISSFAAEIRDIESAAEQAGFAKSVLPIPVEFDGDGPCITSPPDFREWSHRVVDALNNPTRAPADLARDVNWTTSFYGRQSSLSRLGDQQPLVDLTIRRAMGQRISTQSPHHAEGVPHMSVIITTELHKRFLPCYATTLPILNIQVRTAARSIADLAVA